ncbi:Long chain acyl-CoA synthetase 7 peroxisomal [Boothiomyces macroporosus]|uniref:Long-chain-fatty-acid--CoA ligase n=1 Tax=Boothiomyces macroporosus TaxID=261099 RepID=A0AAD5YB56_9FUNG|nr:Long chain acyl-CoA synthetase 7 peroxisomal [Boothiomyces macroporosus]
MAPKVRYTIEDDSFPVVAGYGVPRRVYSTTSQIVGHPEGIFNLHQNLLKGVERGGKGNFMGTRKMVDGKAGEYEWQTYEDVLPRVINAGAGLVKLGLKQNQNVGLFSVNRAEWIIAEQGCFVHGLVTVPLYDTLGAEALDYILNITETPLVVATLDKAQKLVDISGKLPHLKHLIIMDGVNDAFLEKAKAANLNVLTLVELEKLGAENPAEKAEVGTEDIATICFTSGTTGLPKGVLLSHGNILSFLTGYLEMNKSNHIRKFHNNDLHISYLPLAHIFERVVITTLIYVGASVGFYQGDTAKLLDDVEVLKPTIFVSVPRLYNKIYDKVMAGVKASGPVKSVLFKTALATKKKNLAKGIFTHNIWDKLVFDKIKSKLGGRVNLMITGAAPISAEVVEFLQCAFGAVLVQGYGQTENAASATTTLGIDTSSGHIGVPLPVCAIRLRDVPEMNYTSQDKPFPRGEICIKGPSVFKGYYKSPEKTAEALTEDGWLLSGDIGQWDEQGRLVIIDRVKNIFKLAQGEYIAPDKIETVYGNHELVAQCFVYGDSLQSTLVAIVVPEEKALADHAQTLGTQGSFEELVANKALAKSVCKELSAYGRANGLQGFESIKAVYLDSEPFSAENGLLSPTFKFKRHEGKLKYQQQIDAMYAEINQ